MASRSIVGTNLGCSRGRPEASEVLALIEFVKRRRRQVDYLGWRLILKKCLKLHSGDPADLPSIIHDARFGDQTGRSPYTRLQWLRRADEAFDRPPQFWAAPCRTDISLP